MKKLISLFLVAVMVVLAVPTAAYVAFAAEAGDTKTYISKYADYSKDFKYTHSEVVRNEAEAEKDAYGELIAGAGFFAIDQGNGPWKVGEISQKDASFSPFTRILFMINDNAHNNTKDPDDRYNGKNNFHDTQWASTEAQYQKRVEAYMKLYETDNNGATGGLSLWDGMTTLWYYRENDSTGELSIMHNGLSNSGTSTLSAFVYTAEKNCFANFQIAKFMERNANGHSLGILLNGEMIWPTKGGDLSKIGSYFPTKAGTVKSEEEINSALAALNGTELKTGDEVAFVVYGSGDCVHFCPEIVEYQAGETTISIIDTYGPNGQIMTKPSGESFTIPKYTGDLIFLGWDADGDGVADYADGATFTVPNKPAMSLTALVVTPSRFVDNYPTVDADGAVQFNGNWKIGRLDASGVYDLFAIKGDSNIISVTGNPWGSTGGGFYLNGGKIAFSGCTAEGNYVNQIQHTVSYNGTVKLDYTKLIARREVNANNPDDYIEMNFAIYKNGTKIWPADSDWWKYKSETQYSSRNEENNLLSLIHEGENPMFPITVDVKIGDVIEFRTQQGNSNTWMAYIEPSVTYTALTETPTITASGVTVGGDSLALNIYGQMFSPRENAKMGMLCWTAPDANGKFLHENATRLTDATVSGTNLIFSYAGLSAKQMADVIYVKPYSYVEGNDTVNYGLITEMSISKYAENAIKGANNATKTYLKALVNYGAEAQNYFNYNRTNLANAFLDDADRQTSVTAGEGAYAQTGSGTKIKSVSLICDNKLGFKLMVDGVAGAIKYQIEVADNADFTGSTKIDMVAAEMGPEYKAIVSIKNTEITKTLYFRAVIDDAPGATLTYNVEAYFNRVALNGSDSLYYLVASLLNLGQATDQIVGK